jgi:hypothetical protein
MLSTPPYLRGRPEASIVTCCPETGSRMVMAASYVGCMENAAHLVMGQVK